MNARQSLDRLDTTPYFARNSKIRKVPPWRLRPTETPVRGILALKREEDVRRSLITRSRMWELLIVLCLLLAVMADPEAGMEAWQEHPSPFGRVRSVSQSLSIPRPASWIATEASVSESTARDHLMKQE